MRHIERIVSTLRSRQVTMIRMTAAEYLAQQRTGLRRPAEDVEGPVHRSILDLLRLRLGARYLVQHTPNRPRSKVQGGREKALGAVRGWPDLAVYGPGPAGPACWFAEIKPPGTSVPAYQRDVHARLRGLGFDVRILRGIEDAEAALAAWRIPASAGTTGARAAESSVPPRGRRATPVARSAGAPA